METGWIRFPGDSTRTAKWKYFVTYIFRPTRVLGSTSAGPFTKSARTETFERCSRLPSYTSMCTTRHVQKEHFDTGANYVHLDHAVVLILDSLFPNALCLRHWCISRASACFSLQNGYIFGSPHAWWWTSYETQLWAREPCNYELNYIFNGEEFHTSLLRLRITCCRDVPTAAPNTYRCGMFGCNSFLGRLFNR